MGPRRAFPLSPLRLSGVLLLAFLAACAARDREAMRMPVDPAARRPADLVEPMALEPSIRTDVRYATANNFAQRAVYPEARVFLQRPAAEAVARAHRGLAAHGYGLLLFDGYRPWSVTRLFWEITPPAQRDYVADPRKGSRHNRGCAVDLTLFDLATGREVAMPSVYDDFSERAHPGYGGGDPAARARRDLLRAALEAEGFTVYENEWWHFDFRDWREYPLLDLPFSALPRGPERAP